MASTEEQHTITIPWMVLNPPGEGASALLLVSCPNGKIVEIACPTNTEALLKEVIDTRAFWETVFGSLIASLPGDKTDG